MNKAPAFQFYPSDWSRDLEEHPLEIEGAWIRICCKLWWAEERGKLSKTLIQWARILRINIEKTEEILGYIKNEKIGEVSCENPKPNGNITIISRRMRKDEKDRELNRLRQQRFYDKNKPNGSLTPTSQHSSSSSSNNIRIYSSCPHIKIVKLYHDILPELAKIKEWTPIRMKLLKKRWSEKKERQNLEWWKGYFKYVKKSKFLMGEKTDFQADLEWLIRPTNFVKVIEGKYED